MKNQSYTEVMALYELALVKANSREAVRRITERMFLLKKRYEKP